MVIPLRVFVADDHIPILREKAGDLPIAKYLQARLDADYDFLVGRNPTAEEAARRIANGDLETGAAKEAFA